ncbi:MAG: hypothetical protein JNM24_18900 [Bdellovibrionaceae bacterium]|nr:hypothetical protein [Pseudobdellovibrionaceae bacterium]
MIKLDPLNAEENYMKNTFVLLTALVCVMVIQGCTRATNSDSSKIQIQLPNESSVLVPKVAMKTGGLSDPTTLDEINCYGVFVGGPDEELKGKTCALGTSNESFDNHSGGEMVFGDWTAAVPAGQILSMEVKPGIDRVIYLVGMKTIEGGCVDFRNNGMPDKAKMSSAFLLGIAGRLELKAGAETSVKIPMSLNSGKTIVGCRGDEFLRGGDGDGGGSNMPYLRFEGIGSYDSILDVDKATVNECYSFRPALYQGQGNAWTDSGGNDIHINVAGLNMGQFFSGAGCTGPITDLVIPAGQSKSISQYYFRSTTAVTTTLANVVFSGNSEEITGAQHKFDIGQKKIVITGPNRIVLSECYPYKLISSRYEGGFLNTDSSGVSGTLSDMASFNFRTGSDCSSGTSANIAPYSSETTVYLKLLSPASFNLGSYLSMGGGYTVQSFAIDASARGDHYDALVAKLRNDVFIRGECNDFNIHLINSDGGAVKARLPIDIKIRAPQGAGVFYSGPGCIGGSTESVQIAAGDTSVSVSFRAHFIPVEMLTAGKLPIYIDSGSLKLNGVASGALSIVWVDIATSFNNRVMINPPGFSGANIVGSHEFVGAGVSLEIPLYGEYIGLQDVQCSSTPGYGFSTCTEAEVDRSSVPYKYRWTAANASANTSRYVRFAYSSYTTQDVPISAAQMYGPKFKVVNCSAVGPTGANSIASVAALGAAVLCLPADVIYSKVSTNGYSLNSIRQSIIGHSSGTSVLSSAGFSGNVIDIASTNIAEDRYIANIEISNLDTSSIGIKLDTVTATTTAKFYIDNVKMNSANSSIFGVQIVNATDIDLNYVLRNLKINLTGGGSYGAAFEAASRISLEDSEISVSGTSSYGVKLYNALGYGGDTVEISNSVVKVVYGIALGVYNTSTSTGNNNVIRNSRFLRSAPGNGANEIIRIEGKFLTSKFDGNLVMADTSAGNTALMYIYESGTVTTFTMIGNTFVQSMTSPGVVFDGNNSVTEFSKNSFAYTGTSVNNSSGAVRILTAAFSPTSSLSSLGANIGCGVGPYIFNPFHVVASGSLGGSVTLGSVPVYSTNVVLNTGRCRGL